MSNMGFFIVLASHTYPYSANTLYQLLGLTTAPLCAAPARATLCSFHHSTNNTLPILSNKPIRVGHPAFCLCDCHWAQQGAAHWNTHNTVQYLSLKTNGLKVSLWKHNTIYGIDHYGIWQVFWEQAYLNVKLHLQSYTVLHCHVKPIYVFFSGNCATLVPIFIFMCLWAIYIFPESVHIFPAAE
jgi:hypothetical protein